MLNIVMVGGMSECGKSHACLFLAKNFFHRQKIIFFERLLVEKMLGGNNDRNGQGSLVDLYGMPHDDVFREMEKEIVAYCQNRQVANIVLDSTTRVDMVRHFQRSGHNFLSLYIEADFEKRVAREFLKLGKSAPLEAVRKAVSKKDATKLARHADQVRAVSVVIDNNGTAAEFEKSLLEAVNRLLAKTAEK